MAVLGEDGLELGVDSVLPDVQHVVELPHEILDFALTVSGVLLKHRRPRSSGVLHLECEKEGGGRDTTLGDSGELVEGKRCFEYEACECECLHVLLDDLK